MDNMGTNIHVQLEWGRLAMFTQILEALKASTAEVIFFCEHDVLYPKEHFDFIPPKKDVYYYDRNWYKVRTTDDYSIHYEANQLSGLCAYREMLIPEFEERVRRVKEEGWRNSMGYEPGTRGKYRGGFSDNKWEHWHASVPHVDVKHGHNLTTQRWHESQFRNQEHCTGWIKTTADKIPGWSGLMDLLGIPNVHIE
jgi:hypothetical protein